MVMNKTHNNASFSYRKQTAVPGSKVLCFVNQFIHTFFDRKSQCLSVRITTVGAQWDPSGSPAGGQ